MCILPFLQRPSVTGELLQMLCLVCMHMQVSDLRAAGVEPFAYRFDRTHFSAELQVGVQLLASRTMVHFVGLLSSGAKGISPWSLWIGCSEIQL